MRRAAWIFASAICYAVGCWRRKPGEIHTDPPCAACVRTREWEHLRVEALRNAERA